MEKIQCNLRPCYHCSQPTERHCLFGPRYGGKWIFVCSRECEKIMCQTHNTTVSDTRRRITADDPLFYAPEDDELDWTDTWGVV